MKYGQFHRIRRLPPYVFSEVNAMKAAARAAGHDIIDFGMGNPDGATPAPIVDKLIEAVRNPRTHRYSTSRGIPGLRRAQAAYYQRRFGVGLDPDTEIVVTLGSKEGLANLAQAITAPGDVILAPNPSYPIHPYGFIIAGAAIRHVPLVPQGDLMAELAHATEHSVPPPTAIVLNFPSNPTGHVVDLDFYREVVRFARRRDILLLSDLAYAEIYFAEPPPSILQVPGAKDVAVEFTSLSKTYSMPGWRIGFAAGNATLIAALNHCDAFVAENRTRYRERRDVLVEGLRGIGWSVPAPPATMFVWVPIPVPYRELGSLEFSKLLLREARVAVSPGLGFGEYGEGFVRFALVENRQRIRQAVRNIKTFFGRSAPDRARAVA